MNLLCNLCGKGICQATHFAGKKVAGCRIGYEAGADGADRFENDQTVFAQRTPGFNNINNDVAETQDGGKLNRAVQVNQIDAYARFQQYQQ